MRFPGLAILPALLVFQFLAEARQPVRGRQYMVASEEPVAAEVGAAVLKAGGNAVDAAVAMGFALAVTYPRAGNLGGGGFALVRLKDGGSHFVDFRERAPGKATRDMYLDERGTATPDSVTGWRASGVPGTVRGLEYLHRKWGSQAWKRLLAPAVRLARTGFPAPWGLIREIDARRQLLEKDPTAARLFCRIQPNDRFIQTELGAVLARISAVGAQDFYTGVTARRLVREMEKHGGLITAADLRNYKAVERVPLLGKFRGLEVIAAPPPSSGGVGILQMLAVLEGSHYQNSGAGSADTIHFVAETMRRFFADRSEFFGDPDFVRVPVAPLLAPDYIRRLRESIDPNHATPSSRIKPGGGVVTAESSETTHFSIVDAAGNCVSLTYTLNESFGSGVAVPGLGFLLNDEMDDFSAKPGQPNLFGLVQGERNAIQPGKRPLSSMTPAILLREGKPFLVVGGPGGGRIPGSVLQVILNVVDFGLNIQDAIDRPRFHHQWMPDELTLEAGFSPDTIRLLEAKGHKVKIASSVARIMAVAVASSGVLEGAADGRSYGKAEGF